MNENFKLKDDNSNEVKLLSAKKCFKMLVKYSLEIRLLDVGFDRRLHQVYSGNHSAFEEVDETDFEFSFRKVISKWVKQKEKLCYKSQVCQTNSSC